MTNFSTGREAEAATAKYLLANGYKILEQNWRTRWCEIDIVAERKKIVYFVEVKYRLSSAQGEGLDYITPKKLEQMKFAAEFWIAAHPETQGYSLAAIEVSGPDFKISAFVDELY